MASPWHPRRAGSAPRRSLSSRRLEENLLRQSPWKATSPSSDAAALPAVATSPPLSSSLTCHSLRVGLCAPGGCALLLGEPKRRSDVRLHRGGLSQAAIGERSPAPPGAVIHCSGSRDAGRSSRKSRRCFGGCRVDLATVSLGLVRLAQSGRLPAPVLTTRAQRKLAGLSRCGLRPPPRTRPPLKPAQATHRETRRSSMPQGDRAVVFTV